MTDIDSNIDANERARMDQDNQKNVVTPKAGGNRGDAQRVAPNADIDEGSRHEAERQRDGNEGNERRNEGLERDKRNP